MKSLTRLPAAHPLAVTAAALTLYTCVVLLAWQRIDQRPPRWDEAHYLMLSAHSYQALQKHQWLEALSLKGLSDTKPGLVSFLSALSYRFVGESEKRATFLVNALSLVVIGCTLLGLGRRLTGRVRVGAVAWLLFCNLPLAARWSCYYTVDLPLTAAVCATVWLCLAIDDEGFRGWRRAALLGLTVAVGMGTKHLYVAFAAGPLALVLGKALVRSWRPLRLDLRRGVPLVAFLGGGVALGVLYHVLNFHVIREQWLRSRDPALTGGVGAGAPPWEILLGLFEWPPVPGIAWVFAAGVGVAQLAWQRQAKTVYVLAAIAGGYLGVARASSFPLLYYFLPLAPLVCLLACCPLALPLPRLPRPAWLGEAARGLVTAAAVVVLLCCHVNHLFGTPNLARVARELPGVLLHRGRLTTNPMAREDYWTLRIADGNVGALPYPQYWPVREMLEDMVRAVDESPRGRWRRFSVGSFTGRHEYLSVDGQNFKIWQLHWNPFLIAYPVPPGATAGAAPLADFDFLILKTGLVCKDCFVGRPADAANAAAAASLTASDYRRLRQAGFTLLGTYAMPDGSEGTVWRSTRLYASW